MVVRYSNNGEFLHQKAPLNTTKKNFVIMIHLKESLKVSYMKDMYKFKCVKYVNFDESAIY